jgi:hypothetical protein
MVPAYLIISGGRVHQIRLGVHPRRVDAACLVREFRDRRVATSEPAQQPLRDPTSERCCNGRYFSVAFDLMM